MRATIARQGEKIYRKEWGRLYVYHSDKGWMVGFPKGVDIKHQTLQQMMLNTRHTLAGDILYADDFEWWRES